MQRCHCINAIDLLPTKAILDWVKSDLFWLIFWSTWCAMLVSSGWTELNIEYYWFVRVLVSSGAPAVSVDQMSKHNINCLFWNINCHTEHISTVHSGLCKYIICWRSARRTLMNYYDNGNVLKYIYIRWQKPFCRWIMCFSNLISI